MLFRRDYSVFSQQSNNSINGSAGTTTTNGLMNGNSNNGVQGSGGLVDKQREQHQDVHSLEDYQFDEDNLDGELTSLIGT